MKKAIAHLNTKVQESETQAQAKEYIEQILDSLYIQKANGVNTLEAFLNSIYYPTNRQKIDEALELVKASEDKTKKRKKSIKYALFLKYIHQVKSWREDKKSDKAISSMLNNLIQKEDLTKKEKEKANFSLSTVRRYRELEKIN
jgi:hemerythrin